jgi:hypothetical protein
MGAAQTDAESLAHMQGAVVGLTQDAAEWRTTAEGREQTIT